MVPLPHLPPQDYYIYIILIIPRNSYTYYNKYAYIYITRDSAGMGNVAGVPWYNVFNSNLGNNTGKGEIHILILFLATICVTFCKIYAKKLKLNIGI